MVEANPVQIADQVKNASYYSYESSFYLKTDGSLWASGNARYGVLGEQRDEDVTQNEFYRNPILITLKGKSPSLTVKDDNNSGITDSGEPDSGDIDDGDHGSNQKPDQETKTTQETNSKIRSVDRSNHPLQQQRNLLPQQQSQFLEQTS